VKWLVSGSRNPLIIVNCGSYYDNQMLSSHSYWHLQILFNWQITGKLDNHPIDKHPIVIPIDISNGKLIPIGCITNQRANPTAHHSVPSQVNADGLCSSLGDVKGRDIMSGLDVGKLGKLEKKRKAPSKIHQNPLVSLDSHESAYIPMYDGLSPDSPLTKSY